MRGRMSLGGWGAAFASPGKGMEGALLMAEAALATPENEGPGKTNAGWSAPPFWGWPAVWG